MLTLTEKLANEEIPRYSRQLVIHDWGLKKQEKLKSALVTIVGAGGLGSVVAPLLAKAGVGKLRLVDDDVVEEVNMSAQLFHWDKDIGKPKIVSLKEKIEQMNPYVSVELVEERLTRENAERVLGGSTVIVDATDNLDARGIINEFAVKLRIPFVHGGVRDFNGQVTTVIPGEGPCLYEIFGELKGGPRGCPVVNATVSIIASIQALEVIKIITGIGKPLVGKLLIIDGRFGDFDIVEVKKRDDCPICSRYL